MVFFWFCKALSIYWSILLVYALKWWKLKFYSYFTSVGYIYFIAFIIMIMRLLWDVNQSINKAIKQNNFIGDAT